MSIPPNAQSERERHAASAAELAIACFVVGLGYSAIAGGYVAVEFRGGAFRAV